MKKAIGSIFMTLLLVAASALLMSVWQYSTEAEFVRPAETRQTADGEGETVSTENEAEVTSPPEETPEETGGLAAETENNISVRLAVAGSVMAHLAINAEAELADDGGYDYLPMLSAVQSQLEAADCALVSLDTTVSADGVYYGYPDFASPAELVDGLAAVGADLMNTATVNGADYGAAGIQATLKAVEAAGMTSLGTYASAVTARTDGGAALVEIGELTFAFVSYGTYPEDDRLGDDSWAYHSYTDDRGNILYDDLTADMEAIRALGADVVVVCLQWGNELYTDVTTRQTELADFFITQGADLILGGSTHTVQPAEERTVTLEDGTERRGYVVFSLGNLISAQNDLYTNVTAVLDLQITKNRDSGNVYVSDRQYSVYFMVDTEDYEITGTSWRFRLVDVESVLDSQADWMNTDLILAMKEGRDYVKNTLDPAIQGEIGE